MENKDWLNDYMSLKQINPANPFTVPAGYFDNLEAGILSRKKLEDIKNNAPEGGFTIPENYFEELTNNIQSRIAIDAALNEDSGFTVPEGYFDELTNKIQSRIAIEEAVKEAAGFAVPEGYFDELTNNIQSRIAIDEAINNEDAGFAVPAGYFDELTSNIQSRIAIEEAVGGSSVQFTVPEGYFEKLNQSILNKTLSQENVKRRGIVRKMFQSTAFKYATAACFTVAIGGGILLTEISNPASDHKNSFLHKQLSSVPLDDIKSYLQVNVDAGNTQQAVASEGTQVNDADLKNALQNYVDSVQ